ncbi:MAG: 1-acyl-sn-glycerol-3-phosphate acyltransferase [Alphaproteobacteria bacterium]|jgi:1-acyl-sn-glycerol-3-phosphate acyltransferase
MNEISQIARYALAIGLLVPMVIIALLIAPVFGNFSRYITHSWSKIALTIFGVDVVTEFEGDPSQLDGGGVIIHLTQQSIIDGTVAYSAWDRQVMGITNIEYALIPFLGWQSLLTCWVIIRQNLKQSKRQLHKAAQYAADGGLVFLSVEGKRSLDGSLSPYKKGAIVLAIESQAPIHPMYMAGTRACLAAGEWKIRPGKVVIRYLRPISTAGLTYEDRHMLLDKIRVIGEAEHSRWHNAAKSKF